MKSIFKLTLAASVAMLIATGCSNSDGNSSSTITPPANLVSSGKLIDGYIAGGLVFADCNGDNTHQIDAEPSTVTDGKGDFELSVPVSCAEATLIASGGVNLDTGLPFSGVLMAPAGSANITPLTTLVAVDPSFATKIAAYGIAVDTDFISTAIPSDLLIISQQVATAINLTASNTKISDISTIIASVVEPLVTSLATVDLSDSNASASTLSTAASDAFVSIAENDPNIDVTDASVIQAAVNSSLVVITEVIGSAPTDAAGNVVLADVDTETIKTAVEASTDEIKTVVILPIVHITGFVIGSDPEVTAQYNLYTTTTNESSISTSFTANVEVEDAKDNNYVVALSMAVADVNSNRSANVVISNVVMSTLAASGSALTIDPEQVLSATVTGTDANGDLFPAVQLTDGRLGDVMTSNGTAITINMAALLSKVKSTAGETHPLGDFFIPGKYGVTVVASGGIPMDYLNYILDLTINP